VATWDQHLHPEWGSVILAIVATLEADTALVGALGGAHVYRTQDTREVRIPSVSWMIVSDGLGENTAPVDVQLDIWAQGVGQALTVEGRVRKLLHSDLPQEVDGKPMWTILRESRDIADPEPNVIHRALRFEFQPIRERR
jgi:hypothetical protein